MIQKKVYFLLGPPCGGKTSIIKNLKTKLESSIYFLEIGNFIRQLSCQDEYKYLGDILNKGDLPNSNILIEIIKKAIEKNKDKDIFIDGFPRIIEHSELIYNLINNMNMRCGGVYYIKSDMFSLINRTFERKYCPICYKTSIYENICCNNSLIKRQDDTIEILLKRINVFNQNINKILENLIGPIYFFKNDNIDHVSKKIIKTLNIF